MTDPAPAAPPAPNPMLWPDQAVAEARKMGYTEFRLQSSEKGWEATWAKHPSQMKPGGPNQFERYGETALSATQRAYQAIVDAQPKPAPTPPAGSTVPVGPIEDPADKERNVVVPAVQLR